MDIRTSHTNSKHQVNLLHNPAARVIWDKLKVEGYILSLRTARHTHYASSILLPLEILLLILIESTTYCDPERKRTWSHFIDITMVCKAWRAAALSSQKYWSHLPTLPYKHFSELLGRSGQLPLRVKLTSSNWSPSYPQALFNASRLQDLQLFLHKSELENVLAWMAGHISLPLLQRLHITTLRQISIESRLPVWFSLITNDRATLPNGFLGCCPMLKHLDLDALNIPWMTIQPEGPATFTKLVSLKLGLKVACPHQQWIHSMMTSCHLLRELVIPLPKNFQSLPHDTRQTFPSLSTLKIVTHSFADSLRFMASVSLPPLCSVFLQVHGVWEGSAAEASELQRRLFDTPYFSDCSTYPYATQYHFTFGFPSPDISGIQLCTVTGGILFDIQSWSSVCPGSLNFCQLTKLRLDLFPEDDLFALPAQWHTFISKHGAGIRYLELEHADMDTMRDCLGLTAAVPADWRSVTDIGGRWWENQPIAK